MTMAISQNQRKLLKRLKDDLNVEPPEGEEVSMSKVIRACIRYTLAALEAGTLKKEDLNLK